MQLIKPKIESVKNRLQSIL